MAGGKGIEWIESDAWIPPVLRNAPKFRSEPRIQALDFDTKMINTVGPSTAKMPSWLGAPARRFASPLLFAFIFSLFVAVSMPWGMSTPLSFSASDPQCTPKLAESVFACRSPEPARAGSTLDDVIRIFGENDAASYALGAKWLVEGDPGWYALTNAEPPGMMALEAIGFCTARRSGWF
ncbi:MAG TPA: hypothetical protein VEH77_05805 [Roseiarcus sp.]|nr:hypothetical protein [Roseiarcus sp.]